MSIYSSPIDNIFAISNTGVITLENPSNLDYESLATIASSIVFPATLNRNLEGSFLNLSTGTSATAGPVAVKLMFVQAHHNIVTGHYYCPVDTVMKLAGILMFEKFGAYNPNKHKEGFIPLGRLYEFIPAPLFGTKKPQYWEKEIYAAHAEIGSTLPDPKQAYLSLCKELDCYGCAFFEAKQYCLMNFPKYILLG